VKARDLQKRIEKFRDDLQAHVMLLVESRDHDGPDYPVRNGPELDEQAKALSRELGALRPFLLRLRGHWLLQHPISGQPFDMLTAAVRGPDDTLRGHAIVASISSLDEEIGHLGIFDPDDEIPEDLGVPIGSGGRPDRLRLGYLAHLHEKVREGCAERYQKGLFADAAEESVKAVLDYIRDKTGLRSDTTSLVEAAFSEKAPRLLLGDLNDETVRNEQIGLSEMIRGFVKCVRHPIAHRHNEKGDPGSAFECLVMASYFCRRIDDAQVVPDLDVKVRR